MNHELFPEEEHGEECEESFGIYPFCTFCGSKERLFPWRGAGYCYVCRSKEVKLFHRILNLRGEKYE